MEVQQWVCAASAAKACGVARPVTDFYYAGAEYRIAIGVAHAAPE